MAIIHLGKTSLSSTLSPALLKPATIRFLVFAVARLSRPFSKHHNVAIETPDSRARSIWRNPISCRLLLSLFISCLDDDDKRLPKWFPGGIIWLSPDNLALIIMGLENLKNEFPRPKTRGFYKRARQEWKNLVNDNAEGSSSSVARLKKKLKPSRGKLNNYTVFVLWIVLCLQRPWESPEFLKLKLNDLIRGGEKGSRQSNKNRHWYLELSEARGNSIWNRVDGIVSRVLKDYPDCLDLRTLKNHVNKPHFTWSVISMSLDPFLLEDLRSALGRTGAIFRTLSHLMRNAGKSNLIQAAMILIYLKDKKYMARRDLMRKFGISKSRCEYLLKFIDEEYPGYLTILNSTEGKGGSIVYKGPDQLA